MITREEVENVITANDLYDLAVTAWYGGITYWARDMGTYEPAGIVMCFEDVEGGKHAVYEIDRGMLVAAFVTIVNDEAELASWIQEYFKMAWDQRDENGLEMGHIDSIAADVWVQQAALGEILYG